MATGFMALPARSSYRLANATLPAALVETDTALTAAGDGLVRADISIAAGRIAAIKASSAAPAADSTVDLRGGMVWPCFIDMHTHIDKGHIWPRRSNPDGTFLSALDAVDSDRESHWSADDVARRMDFSLRCAHAHGTKLLRTHLDSLPPQYGISWPVFDEMRAHWDGRIDLQAVSLFPVELAADAAYLEALADTVATHGGVFGCVTYMCRDLPALLDRVMGAAAERDLDLDCHTDESLDPSEVSLLHVAEAALRNRFAGRIVCGHCCSLSRLDDATTRDVIARTADAGIAIVSLPMCNLYLQDRQPGVTPISRGVTRLHELAAAGVPVAVASDNTRDPFFAYGDLDMLEVFREAVRICHLDHPFGDWPRIVTRAPADMLRRLDCGVLRAGGLADLVLFRAREWTELLARPQSDRIVVRQGRAIDRTLPDYRELDDLMVRAGAPEDVA